MGQQAAALWQSQPGRSGLLFPGQADRDECSPRTTRRSPARCERLIRLRDGAVIDDIKLTAGRPVQDIIRQVGQLG
jgi:hypothetical protein